jgi:hypothetical protein
MPIATKIPGFTADASVHNTGTYRHTPVDRGAKLPAVVEPALPKGVNCFRSKGVDACTFETAYQSCVCINMNDGSGWDCTCVPRSGQ